MDTTITPKKRIEIIDALRGFDLLGILLSHCLEHFDARSFAGDAGPVMTVLDAITKDTIQFLFLGKAYAIFSMLFGLSFFIQMENQKDRGVDFRLRFVWRLVLLYVIGHFNGLFYSGEILVVYALFGLILIPLYKASTRWLAIWCFVLLFQLPSLIYFVCLWFDPETPGLTTFLRPFLTGRYKEMSLVLTEGSFANVLSYNFWEGQVTKWLYYLFPINMFRIFGLFILGLLIGRLGIHRDESKMVNHAKLGLLWGFVLFVIFFCMNKVVPTLGIEEKQVVRMANQLCRMYINLGLMFMMVGVFVLAYVRLDGRAILNKLAPLGKMSLTNYVMQSLLGAFIFYGFGLGIAASCGPVISLCVALVLGVFQVTFSIWWLKSHTYGPLERVWRMATWLSFVRK